MVKILVTDDAGFFRARIEKILTQYGIEVVVATDGEEAVEKFSEHKPDMVFMDITMPKLDGVSSTQRILKIDPDAKICMLTAMGQQSVVKKTLTLGAKDFIVKPFTEERLVDAIKKILDIDLPAR